MKIPFHQYLQVLDGAKRVLHSENPPQKSVFSSWQGDNRRELEWNAKPKRKLRDGKDAWNLGFRLCTTMECQNKESNEWMAHLRIKSSFSSNTGLCCKESCLEYQELSVNSGKDLMEAWSHVLLNYLFMCLYYPTPMLLIVWFWGVAWTQPLQFSNCHQ